MTASLALLLLALPQSAEPMPARASHVRVDADGARLEEVHGLAAPTSTGVDKLTASGRVWTYTDGGLAWIARSVAVGDRSSQVFAEFDLNNESANLLSVYDADPPTPVWTDNAPLGTEFRSVASADAVDAHVAIHQVVLNGDITTRQAVLRKYSSGSPTPDWSYTFAPIINAAARVGISRDGQTIVGAVYDNVQGEVLVGVFDAAGNLQSIAGTLVGTGQFLRGFDLSADGSTLYFSAGVTAYVLDVATQQVLFNTNIGASFDSHAISGDGSVFAFGNFNVMRVFERSGPTYNNTFSVQKTGQVYCARIDVSDDGSTIAAGWYRYATGLTVELEAVDVASQSATMSETVTGSGSFQNVVADVAISADGSRFAVGLWGAELGAVDELRLYDSSQNTPLFTVDTPGSIFDIDLSADGKRLVAGSKAVHANTLGNGGQVDLADLGGRDLTLVGAPRINSSPLIEYHGAPGENALLLSALDLQIPPQTFPGVGTLHLDKANLTLTPMGAVPAGGVLSYPRPIPDNAALIGLVQHHQVLILPERKLSADWFKLTVLP